MITHQAVSIYLRAAYIIVGFMLFQEITVIFIIFEYPLVAAFLPYTSWHVVTLVSFSRKISNNLHKKTGCLCFQYCISAHYFNRHDLHLLHQ